MSVPPIDPLGPVSQDPEAVRIAACKLVANDATCTPVTVRPSDPGRGLSAAAGGINVLTLMFWVALIIGLIVLLVIVARALARRQARRATDDDVVDDGEAVEVGGVAIDRRREPVDWRKEADGHRRAGRYRDALRCRYRALVGDLARRGLIDEIPGRTTGEERDQLHAVAPGAAAPFDRAADLFDGAWYGDVPVDADAVDEFVELERAVLDATARVAVRVPGRSAGRTVVTAGASR